YGALLNRPNDDRAGYTGHVMDSASGLTYMQQRYYDPQVGRFLSVDPVSADTVSGANFNRYWYADDNAYLFNDPDGRQSRAEAHAERAAQGNEVWGISRIPGEEPSAQVTTFINLNVTTYKDSDGNEYSYDSRNDVSKRSAPGADGPYQSSDMYVVAGPLHNKPIAYGPNSVLTTNDPRGRWLHGGGTGLPNPLAPQQGWKPTLGCTRLQNQDIRQLANHVKEFKLRHPGTPVSYQRVIYFKPRIVPFF
ncbi:MAG: hypothetical protein EOP50_11445, partial [Sphingobacteriales bacterium]